MNVYLTNESLHGLWVCLVLSVASSSVAITITHTEVFAPLRAWMQKLGHMIGYLFQCFYCMSHWIVLLGILIYRPQILNSSSFLADLIVSAFFTLTLSTFVSGIIFKVFLTAMAMKVREKEVKEIMTKK
ncbi:hypothetical protein N0P26_000903 [Acinetobacter baumannii]|uniref:CbrC family protein n=2 Tax=Acinetobacter baumannii TaxID=470 RepID=A0A9P2LET4_ACIBA|nr:DUF1360 domain-containing protein [Acinetobacter baumannii]EKT7958826.1 DUF1360 domain-containing protein [Acinetobacter baumannii]EKT9124856.1 DUF1360 domain-containing protein [Acinetobacter baumannii]EKT9271834.1 DUF1360 domain-containing protein [Acinetobacter baumannii]EKT9313686.1 DUF1360 domain-containing protein [Acinetobacter baumannii]EKU0109402.1 DUF1360 domain-containing protein [Acinetobacter baumannii]